MKSRAVKVDATTIGILMVVVISALAVAIFLELGGFAAFLQEPEKVSFIPITDVPIVLATSSEKNSQGVDLVSSDVSTSTMTAAYIQVKDSCDYAYQGECVRVRSGAGLSHPVVGRLRNGMVLAYESIEEVDGVRWYKVAFNEWLRYPERIKDDWYVAADYVEEVFDNQEKEASSTKKILVDRGDQTLKAFDGEDVFMETAISTGLELTPTPRGTFAIFKKLPTRYMQGPLPYLKDQSYYDVPGVPWNMYFTQQGAVIHGAYWHKSFGTPYSHGCVNLSPEEAKKLYDWASLGTAVIVTD